MPYLMPRARLENGTIVDREVLDRILQDPASKLAAGLNEHDLDTSISTETLDPGLFYTWTSSRLVTEPWLTNAGVPEAGGHGPAASFVVPLSKMWEMVTSVSVTTDGDSALWICAHVVYSLFPWSWTFDPNPPHDLATQSANIQIGIRVDGVLLQTYTGRREENEYDFGAVRLTAPKSSPLGARTLRYTRAHSVGPHFFCIRDILPAFVQSGTHTIELVARVIRSGTSRWVELFTRKLFALELPITGGTTPLGSAPTLQALSDGDVFSTANIATNRLDALVAYYNNLVSGDVRRGGLNHAHYPDTLHTASQGVINTGSSTTQEYPGFGSNLQDPANPGWTKVVSGGGVHLHTDNGGVGWTGITSLLLVLAQVHVNRVGALAAANDDIVNYGCFTLMKKIGGVWTQFTNATSGEAESYVNAYLWTDSLVGYTRSENIEAEVTLFDWMVPTQAVSDIGVWVSAYGQSVIPEVTWDRGAVQVLHLRPQT